MPKLSLRAVNPHHHHHRSGRGNTLRYAVLGLSLISLLSRIIYATFATYLTFTTFDCIPCPNATSNSSSNLFVSRHSHTKLQSSKGMINLMNEEELKSRKRRSSHVMHAILKDSNEENNVYHDANVSPKEPIRKITFEWSITVNESVPINDPPETSSESGQFVHATDGDGITEKETTDMVNSESRGRNLHVDGDDDNGRGNESFSMTTQKSLGFADESANANAQELRLKLRSKEREMKGRHIIQDPIVKNWTDLFKYNDKSTSKDLRNTIKWKNNDNLKDISENTNTIAVVTSDISKNNRNSTEFKVIEDYESRIRHDVSTDETYNRDAVIIQNESDISNNTESNISPQDKELVKLYNSSEYDSEDKFNSQLINTNASIKSGDGTEKICSDECNRFLSIELSDPKNRKWGMILVTGVCYLYALVMLCLFLGASFQFVDLLIIATFIEGVKLFVGFILIVIDSFNGKDVLFNLINVSINVNGSGKGWTADFTYSEYLLDIIVFILAIFLSVKYLKSVSKRGVSPIEEIPSSQLSRGRSNFQIR